MLGYQGRRENGLRMEKSLFDKFNLEHYFTQF